MSTYFHGITIGTNTTPTRQEVSGSWASGLSASAPALVGAWEAVRVQRALENLLSNAIKYSPHGGEVRVEVTGDQTAEARWAVVRVVDQGVGIPARDLPHIFERFRRAGNAGGFGETGIGLAATERALTGVCLPAQAGRR